MHDIKPSPPSTLRSFIIIYVYYHIFANCTKNKAVQNGIRATIGAIQVRMNLMFWIIISNINCFPNFVFKQRGFLLLRKTRFAPRFVDGNGKYRCLPENVAQVRGLSQRETCPLYSGRLVKTRLRMNSRHCLQRCNQLISNLLGCFEMVSVLEQIDPTGDGSIDFNTFTRCMSKNFAPASTEAEVLEVGRTHKIYLSAWL